MSETLIRHDENVKKRCIAKLYFARAKRQFRDTFSKETTSMEEILNTELCKILVDTTKNRVYYTMSGFWQELSDVPGYLEAWEKAASMLASGFTVLSDIRELQLMSPQWAQTAGQAQQNVVKAGLIGTAEIIPAKTLLKSQVNRVSRESGMVKKTFSDPAEAETWLDSLSE